MPLAFAHLDSLNTEQRRAEGDYALSGPFLVIASAGSGDIGTPVQMAYLRSATLAILVHLGGAHGGDSRLRMVPTRNKRSAVLAFHKFQLGYPQVRIHGPFVTSAHLELGTPCPVMKHRNTSWRIMRLD